MTINDLDSNLLAQLGIAGGAGALGGVARYYATNREDFPRSFFMGIVAAFAALFLTRPQDWLGLVTSAAAAGYAADAVLAGYQSRIKLETAKAEANNAKLDAEEAKKATKDTGKKLAGAEADVGKAIGALKTASGTSNTEEGLETNKGSLLATLAAELEAAQTARCA